MRRELCVRGGIPRRLVEVAVHIPASVDLRAAVAALGAPGDEVLVSALAPDATVAMRRTLPTGDGFEAAESAFRLEVAGCLRRAGIQSGGE